MPLEMPEKDNTFVLKVSPTLAPQLLWLPQEPPLWAAQLEAVVGDGKGPAAGQQEGSWLGVLGPYTGGEHPAGT